MQVKQFLYDHRYKILGGTGFVIASCVAGLFWLSAYITDIHQAHICSYLRFPNAVRSLLLYAQKHEGRYPDDLYTLHRTDGYKLGAIDCTGLISTTDNSEIISKEMFDHRMKGSFVVYVGKGVKLATEHSSREVVLYTRPHAHRKYGRRYIVIGFSDGSVYGYEEIEGLAELKKYGINVKGYDNE